MQMLEVKDLKPHPKNEELFDDIEGQRWSEFKESILRRGVVEPIVVTQDLVIVSGALRLGFAGKKKCQTYMEEYCNTKECEKCRIYLCVMMKYEDAQ